jgi:hypothetical protein
MVMGKATAKANAEDAAGAERKTAKSNCKYRGPSTSLGMTDWRGDGWNHGS